MDELTAGQMTALHDDLLRLRDDLERQLAASRDGARPVDLGEPIGRLTRMDAIQQQKMTQALRGDTKLRLQQVQAALQRHKAGDYGDCALCDDPIGYPRLQVRPEVNLCVACQSDRES